MISALLRRITRGFTCPHQDSTIQSMSDQDLIRFPLTATFDCGFSQSTQHRPYRQGFEAYGFPATWLNDRGCTTTSEGDQKRRYLRLVPI
jgi:hypothetical protein